MLFLHKKNETKYELNNDKNNQPKQKETETQPAATSFQSETGFQLLNLT